MLFKVFDPVLLTRSFFFFPSKKWKGNTSSRGIKEIAKAAKGLSSIAERNEEPVMKEVPQEDIPHEELSSEEKKKESSKEVAIEECATTREAKQESRRKDKWMASKDLEGRSMKKRRIAEEEIQKKESREGRKLGSKSQDIGTLVLASENRTIAFREVLKYGLSEVILVMLQLESLCEEYEEEIGKKRLLLAHFVTFVHFLQGNWCEERENTLAKVHNLKKALKEEQNRNSLLVSNMANILQMKKADEARHLTIEEQQAKRIDFLKKKNEELRQVVEKHSEVVLQLEAEMMKKDEILKLAMRDYTERIKELSKQNADLLQTREEYLRTIVELKREKNELEKKNSSAEELRRKVGPMLKSYFEGVISLLEEELP